MDIEKVKDDIDFICPYCKQVLEKLLSKEVKVTFIGTKPIYACPNCKSVLPSPNAF